MRDSQGGEDGTTAARFIEEVARVEGVERVALFDRAGRVLGASGFDDRAVLMDAAALAVAVQESGVRLSLTLGRPEPGRLLISSGDAEPDGLSTLVLALPTGRGGDALRLRNHVVLLVLGSESALASLGPEPEDFAGPLAGSADLVDRMPDPEGFETSLIESLDRLFP